jgi:hypothetical protein
LWATLSARVASKHPSTAAPLFFLLRQADAEAVRHPGTPPARALAPGTRIDFPREQTSRSFDLNALAAVTSPKEIDGLPAASMTETA